MSMGFLQQPPRPFLSRFPSSSLSFLFSHSLLLLAAVQTVNSSVVPSNRSADYTHWFDLGGHQVDLPRDSSIAPLTRSLVSLDAGQLRVSLLAMRVGISLRLGPAYGGAAN